MKRQTITVAMILGILLALGCRSGGEPGGPGPSGGHNPASGEGEGSADENPNGDSEGGEGGSGGGDALAPRYNSARLQGSRSELQALAGSLSLGSSLDLINGQGQSSSLGLTSNAYDRMSTSTFTFDPSLSFMKRVRSALCILGHIDYRSVPESEQVVAREIRACLPRAAQQQGGSQSGSQAGGQQGGGQQATSQSSTSRTPTSITWESFINTDRSLVVVFRYLEKPEVDWAQEQYKTIEVVIEEGASELNPFGRFSLFVTGRSGSQDGFPIFASEMRVGAMDDVLSLLSEDANQIKIAYIEQDQGGAYTRMIGEFKIGQSGAQQGRVVGGSYIADLEGWSAENQQPGRYYISFDSNYLHSKRVIPDLSMYFGEDFVLHKSEDSMCYLPGQFDTHVFGYRAFNADKSEVEMNNGFSFVSCDSASQNCERNLGGYASYWGVHAYDLRSGQSSDIPSGTVVYKEDHSQWDPETGMPFLNLQNPYTIHVKPGKITKHKRQVVDVIRLEGRSFDWVHEWDDQNQVGIFYRARFTGDLNGDNVADDPGLIKTHRWNDAGEDWANSRFMPITEVPMSIDDGNTIYVYSESLGGQLILTKVNSSTFSATVTTQEVMNSMADTNLSCLGNCPKNSISIDSLRNHDQESIYHPNPNYASDARVMAFKDFALLSGALPNSTPISLSGQPDEHEWVSGVWVEFLVNQADFDAILATHYNGQDPSSINLWELREHFNEWYSYSMGFSSWDKTILLKDASNQNVAFDAPISFEYTVQAGDIREGASQTPVGQSYRYTIEGGYLNVPWESVGTTTDPFTGQEYEKWSPAVALKDGLYFDADGDSQNDFIIKADYVQREMKSTGLSNCSALELPSDLEAELPERRDILYELQSFSGGGYGHGDIQHDSVDQPEVGNILEGG